WLSPSSTAARPHSSASTKRKIISASNPPTPPWIRSSSSRVRLSKSKASSSGSSGNTRDPMSSTPFNVFECHMYVSARGAMKFNLPVEPGPKRIARLEPLEYELLIDPSFRRLLAAFESLPQPSLQTVQV